MKNNPWFRFGEPTNLAGGKREVEVEIYDEISNYWGVAPKEFSAQLKEAGDVDLIRVAINSPGGSITAGYAIFNMLRHHPARVETRIDGLAASMASVIAMAGDSIKMASNAMMFVHNPQGVSVGDADGMRKTADILDKFRDTIVNTYADQVGDKLTREGLIALLNDETWMTAEEALEYGFVDEIVGEVLDAAASIQTFDLSAFPSMPVDSHPEGRGKDSPTIHNHTMFSKNSKNTTADDIKAALEDRESQIVDLTKERDEATNKIVELERQLSETAAEAKNAATELAEAKAEIETIRKEVDEAKAAVANFEKKVAAKAADFVASQGHEPLPDPGHDSASPDILETYNGLKGAEKTKFLREHKAELHRAARS